MIEKSLYLASSVDLRGRKDLFGISGSEFEGAKYWLSLLADLRALVAATGASTDLKRSLTVLRLTPGNRLISLIFYVDGVKLLSPQISPFLVFRRSAFRTRQEYRWVNFMLLLVGHFYRAGDTHKVGWHC